MNPNLVNVFNVGVQRARAAYVDQLEQANRPSCFRCDRAALQGNVGCAFHRRKKNPTSVALDREARRD